MCVYWVNQAKLKRTHHSWLSKSPPLAKVEPELCPASKAASEIREPTPVMVPSSSLRLAGSHEKQSQKAANQCG